MNKKIIVFDLDNTLAKSKCPIEYPVTESLYLLLEKYDVAVISGCRFEQFAKQVLAQLNLQENQKQRLHLFPTSGIQYYRYNLVNKWIKVYDERMTDKEIQKIINALEIVIKDEGLDTLECYGERIENRENCQITYSAYGQQAPLEIKEKFDPDRSKRMKMREKLLNLLPEFSIRLGGKSSIDITQKGIDKAYGIRKIIEYLNVIPENILFIGDELNEGGNDYPVYEIGIDCVKTSGPKETNEIINKIINGDFVGLNIIHNRNT